MKEISILLVGIGGYGENYIKEYYEKSIPGVTLCGVADPFAKRSPYYERLLKDGIKIYDTPQEFFFSNTASLVVISSPIHTHYDYIMCALEHKANVLCEKPVTISIEKMNKLIEAEERSGCFVAVGYQLCFSKDVLKLKEDILSGVYGRSIKLKALRMMRRTDTYYKRTGWSGRLSHAGEYVFDSPVSNACAHQIQVMLFLLGSSVDSCASVSSVDATLYKARVDIENYDAAALKITLNDSTPLYYYTAHSLDEKKVGPIYEFIFEKGRIVGNDDKFIGYLDDGTTIDYTMIDKGERLQKLYDSIDATRNNSKPCCTLKTSLSHIDVVIKTQANPVYLCFDAKRRESEDGDYYYAIPDLKESFLSLYESWRIK